MDFLDLYQTIVRNSNFWSDVYAISKKANLKPDSIFAIKAELLRRPMIPLCFALFVTIGYAALIMRIL